MIPYRPPAVYVTERVRGKPALDRMERILEGLAEAPEPQQVSDEELEVVVEELSYLGRERTGQIRRDTDPVLFLNAFSWEDEDGARSRAARHPGLNKAMLLGQGPWTFRDASSCLQRWGGVCQSAYEIHSVWGCLHACSYCHVGNYVNLMLDLERFAEALSARMRQWPQSLYKYDNQTDTICFEPEYGASEILVPLFARSSDAYLLLYTKSDNVDHLLDLPHRGKTLINWSLSCDTVSREIERGAPSVEARIEAARRCHRAGYGVRFRFSPVIPVKDWRNQYARAVHALLSRIHPELITLDVLGWMTRKEMDAALDRDLLAPDCLSHLYAGPSRPPFSPCGKQLFRHSFRETVYRFLLKEIRRHDPDVPVSVCMETPEMWERLREEMAMTPETVLCCCGPDAVPPRVTRRACPPDRDRASSDSRDTGRG